MQIEQDQGEYDDRTGSHEEGAGVEIAQPNGWSCMPFCVS